MKDKKEFLANTLIIILSAILVYSFIYIVLVVSGDELWNFNTTFKMYNGYTLYNDSNLIITPFFFYIAYIFFDIFSASLVTFRIYGVLITILLLYFSYKIISNLNTTKNLRILYTALTFLLTFQILVAGANYNTLAVVFILMGVNLYLNNKSSNLKQGLIIFLVFFTKQNMGVYYGLSVVVYELVKNKFTLKYILDQFKKFIFFLIPSCIILAKMYFIDGNFFSFINYCFGGLFEFGEQNITVTAAPFFFAIPLSTIGLYIFTMIKRDSLFSKIKDEFFNNLTLLFIFATINSLVIYPIFNSSHFIFTFPLHLIFMFYFFDYLLLGDLFSEEKYKTPIKYGVAIILAALVIRTGFYYFQDKDLIIKYRNENSVFNHLYSYQDQYQKTKDLKNYIYKQNQKGITVLICSHDAAFPMIELKQSHGMYDLLFNGNLGLGGKDKIKHDVDTLKNTEFLVVTNEEDIFVQEPPEIRSYIMDNLECVGTIHNYSIYSTEITN